MLNGSLHMQHYYRFCSTIHYFFDKKIKLSDPGIYSILFISMIESFYLLGGYYFVCVFILKRLMVIKFYMLSVLMLLVLLNYLLVYRNARQYEYSKKLNPIIVIFVVILAYAFMGIGGSEYRKVFSNM